MNAFIITHQENETDEIVSYINYYPETLDNSFLSRGELINTSTIPQPEDNGKISQLYRNTSTKEFFYKYVDVPKTPERLQADRISALEVAIAQMLGM